MKKKVTVKVKQPEEIANQVPVEVLATEIKAISDGIKKLRSGRLTDKALILLIQHAAPKVGGRYGAGQIGTTEIRGVLDGMEGLAKQYLRNPNEAR